MSEATYSRWTVIVGDRVSAGDDAVGVDSSSSSHGSGGGAGQGVVRQQSSIDHRAVLARWRENSRRLRGRRGGGRGNNRRARTRDGVSTARVAGRTVGIVVLTNSKVDTDGDTGDDDDGSGSDQDFVLGLHGLLLSLFDRHFRCVLRVSGDMDRCIGDVVVEEALVSKIGIEKKWARGGWTVL